MGREKHLKIDAIYIVRPQVEQWTDEELQRYIKLPAAKRELERRKRQTKEIESEVMPSARTPR